MGSQWNNLLSCGKVSRTSCICTNLKFVLLIFFPLEDGELAPEDEETRSSQWLIRYQFSLRCNRTWAAGCSKEEEAVAHHTRSLKRHATALNTMWLGTWEKKGADSQCSSSSRTSASPMGKALEHQVTEPTVPVGTVGANQVKE